MKVLFIGGNGNISWWCVEEALRRGDEVYELNRAMTRATRRAVQPEVHEIIADIRDEEAAVQALSGMYFDAVCDFICFNDAQARQAIEIFKGKTDQYIVLSSEAVYRRESRYLPFREDSPQYDEDVEDTYIAGKIKAEKVFSQAYRNDGFPVTIVRPGYTYDTIIQVPVGQNCFTAPQRFLAGYPFLMLGDGQNLVAPMHSKDFAKAFAGLIGNQDAIGEDYHIAAEQLITWNEMAETILTALGLDAGNILHIPRDEAAGITDFYSSIVNRQHMWHYIFDDAKIKSAVPGWKQKIRFSEGMKDTVSWLLADKVRQRFNPEYDRRLENLYRRYWNGGNVH
ncbi:MAG: NAD-dependent epimerase/dehydratase family protein [Firmicutes bacterium]|nr:NAD-dependent epimerase/dehydratase family protein [Bacillota bacterium]